MNNTIPPEAIPADQLAIGQKYRIVAIASDSTAYCDEEQLLGKVVEFMSIRGCGSCVLGVELLEGTARHPAGSYGWYCSLGPLEPQPDPLELAWFDYTDQTEILPSGRPLKGLESDIQDAFQAGWQAAKEHFTKGK